jgi:hypothetical protein
MSGRESYGLGQGGRTFGTRVQNGWRHLLLFHILFLSPELRLCIAKNISFICDNSVRTQNL